MRASYPIPQPQPLPPISRQQFRDLSQSGRWQITTHPSTYMEKTSVIDPYTSLACGDCPDDACFFDSYTHQVMMATSMYYEKEFGETAEDVRDLLRSQPKRYWELPQTDSFDARSELQDYIETVSDDGRRSALASAINTRQAFRSFAEEATDEERIDWRGFEDEWKHWMLWNFFLEHGVQPEAVGEDT